MSSYPHDGFSKQELQDLNVVHALGQIKGFPFSTGPHNPPKHVNGIYAGEIQRL